MKEADKSETVTLCDSSDSWAFHEPMVMREPMLIRHSRPSLWSRFAYAFRNRFPWFWPRSFVSAIDHEAGSITLSVERWNWLRWKWEVWL